MHALKTINNLNGTVVESSIFNSSSWKELQAKFLTLQARVEEDRTEKSLQQIQV